MLELSGSIIVIDEPMPQGEFLGNGGSNTPPGLPETINGRPDHPPIPESPEVIDARFGEIASDARFGEIAVHLAGVATVMDRIVAGDGYEHTTEPKPYSDRQRIRFIEAGLSKATPRAKPGVVVSLQNFRNTRPKTL
ncbi:hypothetical protein EOM60_01130 [Candidatus Saccharibacteria bacterium]|nr:hypothetical protein [Candidatus Saccharibacteria bacterium]